MTTLSFEPLISPALWVTLAVSAAALLAWYCRSRPAAVARRRWAGIIALSALGLAAVLVILLNPTWVEPIAPPAGKPLLTVLLDSSASMAATDAADGNSRFQAGTEIAKSLSDDLSSRFEVRVRTFAASTTTADVNSLAAIAPEGLSTDMAAAVSGSIEDDRPQGQALFVLSDGIHNGAGGVAALLETTRTARAMGVPIYTRTLGGSASIRDLDVTLARPQKLAFIGQNVSVTVLVRQRGALAGAVELVLSDGNEEISRQSVQLTADSVTTTRFEVNRETSGVYRYEVHAEHIAGEATHVNNSTTFLLRVVEDPIRVLLLEGKPYWDAKFLMRTLASDSALELHAVVRLRENRFLKRSLHLARSDPDAPARRVESTEILTDPSVVFAGPQGLDSYQILVLGRDVETFLTEPLIERLREWISRDGGSLICYRGTPVASVNQALGRMLPIRWTRARESRFRVELTGRGENLNWLTGGADEPEQQVLSRLPSLATTAKPERPRPLAVVLARSEGEAGPPVLVYQPYGTGRVVTVEGAGMWRWAFLAPEFQEHDATYSSLWQSLLRWLVSSVGLVPGQDRVLRMDKVSWKIGESAVAMLLMREEAEQQAIPKIELTGTGAKTVTELTPVPLGDEPGVYQIVFGRLPEGRYRATIAGSGQTRDTLSATVAFDVRPDLREQLDIRIRPDIMLRIAQESGGAVIEDADPSSVARSFQEHISRSRPGRVRRLMAWDRWWVLLGVFAIWGTAWGLRRAGGLI